MSEPKIPAEVEALATSLEKHAEKLTAASLLPMTSTEDPRDEPVAQILRRCSELARATGLLGRHDNAVGISAIARTVLENLILLLWVVLDERNAQELEDAAHAELTRVALINLRSGKLRVKNRHTGEDATAEFLASDRFGKLPKRRSIASRAEDADVVDLYNVFYRFLSLETHGHDQGSEGASEPWQLASMHMQGIGALASAVGHAGVRWLLNRERTDNETLRRLLGFDETKSTSVS